MSFLRSGAQVGGAVALAAALGVTTSAAAQSVNWNLSMWGKERAFTRVVEVLAEEVEKATDGNFKIRIHYGEALSAARENLDGIQLGAFQMAVFCASYHPQKTPTLASLDLPFLPFANLDIQERVHEAVFKHPAVEADLARWNARLIISGLLPQYEFMGVGNPPMTLEDWKGKRVRALGGLGDAMQKLGAVPTTVPAPETYQLLERGAVDAVSWPFSYAHAAYRVDEISRWFTSNMSPGAIVCPVVANIDAYNKLPDNYKQAIEDAKPAAYAAVKAAYREADDKNLPRFRERMTEIEYSAEMLDQFRKAAGQPVWDDWVKRASEQGVPAQELLDLIMSEAEKAQG